MRLHRRRGSLRARARSTADRAASSLLEPYGEGGALRAILDELGEVDEGASFKTPDVARASLSHDGAMRLRAFERVLRECWLLDAPHHALATAWGELLREPRVVVYRAGSPGAPPWWSQRLTSSSASDAPWCDMAKLARIRLHLLEGADPFANRPVSLGPLLAQHPSAATALAYTAFFLHANGVARQLRMVLYERRRASLFIGVHRRADEPPFAREDHALFLAARPALRVWSRVARAVGRPPLGEGGVTSLLLALDEPALLVRKGRIVFTNPSGRAWVEPVRERIAAGTLADIATISPLTPGGVAVELVLPSTPAPAPRFPLPPMLSRVAELLADGATDKEIAARLELSPATARTYVTRVLQRLGVRSRRALMFPGATLPRPGGAARTRE